MALTNSSITFIVFIQLYFPIGVDSLYVYCPRIFHIFDVIGIENIAFLGPRLTAEI